MITVAIHQPNFFPWLGFFDKLAKSDIFILLDDAQAIKTGGSWVNRTLLPKGSKAAWSTVPIQRVSGYPLINEVQFSNRADWQAKFLQQLNSLYKECVYVHDTLKWLQDCLSYETNHLCDFNLNAIRQLCGYLHIDDSKCIRSSSLGVTTKATQRLIDLIKAVEGDAYLCGGGSAGYLDEGLFQRNQIQLRWQNFQPGVYSQSGRADFLPGLSVLDALMNIGPTNTRELLGLPI